MLSSQPELPPTGSEGLARTLRALVVGTTHLVGLVEVDGTVAYVSPSVTRFLGYPPEQLVGSNVLSLIHPDDQGMAISMLGAACAEAAGTEPGDADVAGEYRLHHADGRWLPFEVLRNSFVTDPDVGGVLVIGREIVVRRALDDALGALAYDEDGTVALRKLVEYLDVRLPGTTSAFLIPGPEETWVTSRVPEVLLTASGPWRSTLASGEEALIDDLWEPGAGIDAQLRADAVALELGACWCVPLPIRRPRVYSPAAPSTPDGPVLGCLVVWSARRAQPSNGQLGVIERVGGLADVALHRRATTRALRDLVVHDSLTGALSRSGFEGRSAGDGVTPGMLILIDLDDFKMVNDRYGHPLGDEVLKVTAQRIQSLLRPGDFLGRLGGDEFVLHLSGAELAEAQGVADRILLALEAPVADRGVSVRVRASLGIAPFDTGIPYAELIGRADAAMYAAKRQGKGHWTVWHDGASPLLTA